MITPQAHLRIQKENLLLITIQSYLYYIYVHVILPQIESIINHTCLFPCYILVHEIQLIFLTSQEQDTQEYLINLFKGWIDKYLGEQFTSAATMM